MPLDLEGRKAVEGKLSADHLIEVAGLRIRPDHLTLLGNVAVVRIVGTKLEPAIDTQPAAGIPAADVLIVYSVGVDPVLVVAAVLGVKMQSCREYCQKGIKPGGPSFL